MAGDSEQRGRGESRAMTARRTRRSVSKEAKRMSSSRSRATFIGGESRGDDENGSENWGRKWPWPLSERRECSLCVAV
jgi:hypothetical protein